MSNRGTGIPEMIGDIPGSLFVSGNTGAIETASGPLQYHFTEDKFWLNYGPQTDPHNGEYHDFPHFSAVVEKYRGRNCMVFSARSTVDITPIRESFGLQVGQKHRGIRAAELLGASIAYARGYSWNTGLSSRIVGRRRQCKLCDVPRSCGKQCRSTP